MDGSVGSWVYHRIFPPLDLLWRSYFWLECGDFDLSLVVNCFLLLHSQCLIVCNILPSLGYKRGASKPMCTDLMRKWWNGQNWWEYAYICLLAIMQDFPNMSSILQDFIERFRCVARHFLVQSLAQSRATSRSPHCNSSHLFRSDRIVAARHLFIQENCVGFFSLCSVRGVRSPRHHLLFPYAQFRLWGFITWRDSHRDFGI